MHRSGCPVKEAGHWYLHVVCHHGWHDWAIHLVSFSVNQSMNYSIRVWFEVLSHTLHSFGPLINHTKAPLPVWILLCSEYKSDSELNRLAGRMGKSDAGWYKIKVLEWYITRTFQVSQCGHVHSEKCTFVYISFYPLLKTYEMCCSLQQMAKKNTINNNYFPYFIHSHLCFEHYL